MSDLDVGDVIWAELDPVRGTEQAKRRPALVLTSTEYHRRSPRTVICPISRTDSLWSFNAPLPAGMKTKGVVQIDQIRTVDRAERLFRVVERAPADFMASIQFKLAAFLNIESLAQSGKVASPPSDA